MERLAQNKPQMFVDFDLCCCLGIPYGLQLKLAKFIQQNPEKINYHELYRWLANSGYPMEKGESILKDIIASPDQIRNRKRLVQTFGVALFEILVSHAVNLGGEQVDPLNYSAPQAMAILKLFHDVDGQSKEFSPLYNRGSSHQFSKFESAFQGLISLNSLAHGSDQIREETESRLKYPFHFGALTVYAEVNHPDTSHISPKTAIRRSVVQGERGATLIEDNIVRNRELIAHTRRMIKITDMELNH